MKIALDAMGGDNAPHSNVGGAFEFINMVGADAADIILVGDTQVLTPLIKQHPDPHHKISVFHAPDTVGMNDKPATILKTKPESSMVKAVELVRDGQADAIVSAGNTGALLTASTFLLGRVKGIIRPVLSAYIPGYKGGFMLCDAGANPVVKPPQLVQFALMASAHLECIEGKKNPTIGLLNIGSEENKGNELTQSAYPLMKEHVPNFIGNIEARYILDGNVDVVVCDGFVGNTVLKFIEGVMLHMIAWFEDIIGSQPNSKELLSLMKPTFEEMAQKLDYEEHGATPLLGVNNIVLKSHGSSSAKSICNSLHSAQKAYHECLIPEIAERIAEHMMEY